MNTDATNNETPADEPEPAEVDSTASIAPPPPRPEKSTRSKKPFVAAMLGAVMAAAIAGLLVAWNGASDERDDAQAELDRVAAEHDDTRAALDDVRAAVEANESEISQLTEDLSAAESETAKRQSEVDELATQLADATSQIDEYEAGTAEFLTAVFLVEGTFGGGQAEAACVADELMAEFGPDLIRLLGEAGFIATGTPDSDVTRDLLMLGLAIEDSMATCGVDPEAGLLDGNTYGDNPTLDALWDRCDAGEGAACDELYERSRFGTDYEEFGYTCGNRFTVAESIEACIFALDG